jgi:hypothetical protein
VGAPTSEIRWNRGLTALRAWSRVRGGTRVPHEAVVPDPLDPARTFALGHWVDWIRTVGRNPERMATELWQSRRRDLDALGFEWSPSAERADRRQALLDRVADLGGPAAVPPVFGLGQALRAARHSHLLRAADIDWLTRSGFTWSVQAYRWSAHVDLLDRWLDDGHAITRRTVTEGVAIGRWWRAQLIRAAHGLPVPARGDPALRARFDALRARAERPSR